MLQSYCDYLLANWTSFESGNYKALIERPLLSYKTLLTEEIVKENLPELSAEERILLKMETLEIKKEQAN